MAATTATVSIGYDQQVALVQEKMPSRYAGGVRVFYWEATIDGTGTLTAEPVITLPSGPLLILPSLCGVYFPDTTASATLDYGYAAYVDQNGDTQSADGDYFADGLIVGAGPTTLNGFMSVTGTTPIAVPAGGVIPLKVETRDGLTITITSAVADFTAVLVQGWIGFVGGTAN